MSATTADPLVYVREIYQTAREVSHETRGVLATHLDGGTYSDPGPKWEHVLAERAGRGVTRAVASAGGRVTRAAAAAGQRRPGPAVRLAVKNVVRAVEELAAFVPEYETLTRYDDHLEADVSRYEPTAQSVEHLDQLRQRVFVRLVELDEQFRSYPDPLSRLNSVNQRTAHKLHPTAEAARLGRWFERMEQAAG